ncbi:MAG: hypothetical protein HN919_09355, partial [Verrucomicrobia bacterium]|nr:hypothetical protein [Verrucomicrobiota bacterium]
RERISHRIHHRYTMVKGVDPETEYPDPPTTRWLKRRLLRRLLDILFVGAILTALQSVWHLVRLAAGWQDKLMREQCAAKDVRVMRREAIAILLIQVAVIGGALWFRRWEPILFVSLATSVGGAMVGFYNDTQHIGLMYNTNDQRLSTRSVRCGPFVHLLFWGLDDHIEHHDFPSVPSRNLPRLRRLLNQEIPEAKSLVACWQEIFAIAREKEQHPDHVFAPPPIASPQIGQLSQARGEME